MKVMNLIPVRLHGEPIRLVIAANKALAISIKLSFFQFVNQLVNYSQTKFEAIILSPVGLFMPFLLEKFFV